MASKTQVTRLEMGDAVGAGVRVTVHFQTETPSGALVGRATVVVTPAPLARFSTGPAVWSEESAKGWRYAWDGVEGQVIRMRRAGMAVDRALREAVYDFMCRRMWT